MCRGPASEGDSSHVIQRTFAQLLQDFIQFLLIFVRLFLGLKAITIRTLNRYVLLAHVG